MRWSLDDAWMTTERVKPLAECYVKAHANGHNKSQHCCVLLGVFGQQCCVRLHGPKNLTGFKLYATSANKCQHVWFHANGRNMLGPTMLRVVGQQCCVCLHARPLESGGKSIYSSNLHTYTRGGVLPSKRLLGMCRWTESHFHNCVDYNGVTLLVL